MLMLKSTALAGAGGPQDKFRGVVGWVLAAPWLSVWRPLWRLVRRCLWRPLWCDVRRVPWRRLRRVVWRLGWSLA
jgi:hypothetical protein